VFFLLFDKDIYRACQHIILLAKNTNNSIAIVPRCTFEYLIIVLFHDNVYYLVNFTFIPDTMFEV
jgi:hypothetical protein